MNLIDDSVRILIFSVLSVVLVDCTTKPHAANADEIKPMEFVRYSEFGAKGDGKADDIDAIAAAHAYANEHNLAVRAEPDATYYIGGRDKRIIIQTDTDFGKARFTIDDRDVENRKAHVFEVRSKLHWGDRSRATRTTCGYLIARGGQVRQDAIHRPRLM